MTCFSRSVLISLMMAVLYTPNAIALPARSEAPDGVLYISQRVQFRPADRGTPTATIGSGSRGSCTHAAQDELLAIAPTQPSIQQRQPVVGLTNATHPSFWVYVPELTEDAIALSLMLMRVDATQQETLIATQWFGLPTQVGVVELPLPATLPPLQPDTTYHWYVSVVCGEVDQSGNAIADGWLEYVAPEGVAQAQDPLVQAAVYGEAGLWYDMIDVLATLRQGSSAGDAAWQDVLAANGLAAIATRPLYPQPLTPIEMYSSWP